MPSDDQGEEEDSSRACNTRRAILWLCGVVTVGLEVVGLAFQFAAPDATVLGFTISTMVNVLTIILSFVSTHVVSWFGYSCRAHFQLAL